MSDYILWLHEVEMSDVDRVGGKNASLGDLEKLVVPAVVTGQFVVAATVVLRITAALRKEYYSG